MINKLYFLFAMASAVFWQAAAQNFDTIQIRSTKLTESIYMLEGHGGNIGVCIGDDGTFIIDDQFAPLTKKIKAAISQLTDKPVQFVINTHFHHDHSGGNENFGGEGALIVAHEGSRKRMEASDFFQQQGTGTSSPAPAAALPKITFAESMAFHYNKQTIHIYHLTNAHTDGDAIIYFKEANVIHMGDIFVRYGLPYIDEPKGGTVNGMIETINYVLSQIDDNTKIIPGHGKLATKQDMIAYNNMLTTIRDRVKKLMDKGKTIEEIVKADPFEGFEKRGVKTEDFINVVYKSILKAKS